MPAVQTDTAPATPTIPAPTLRPNVVISAEASAEGENSRATPSCADSPTKASGGTGGTPTSTPPATPTAPIPTPPATVRVRLALAAVMEIDCPDPGVEFWL